MKWIMMLLVLGLSTQAFSQKIVFEETFHRKNLKASTTSIDAGDVEIIEDPATMERLVIYSAKKEISFYYLDKNWKLIKKFSPEINENSMLNKGIFIVKSQNNQGKWHLITKSSDGAFRETVDFNSMTHSVEKKLYTDQKKYTGTSTVYDDDVSHIIYKNTSNYINMVSIDKELKLSNFRFNLTSNLPSGSNKKYDDGDIFELLQPVYPQSLKNIRFTRDKVQLYTFPGEFAVLISNNEADAELSFYDRKNGKKIKSNIYSAQSYLPKKTNRLNSSAVFHNNRVYLLVAHKSGGVFLIFDAETKKELFKYIFSENDKELPFNYGPVMYETMPGVKNRDELRERVSDISMKEFCKELFKSYCGISIKEDDKGKTIISFGTHEQKVLPAATSEMRKGMNTITSPSWYTAASAGFIFEHGGFNQVNNKLTWNQVYGKNIGEKYQHVVDKKATKQEWDQKTSVIMGSTYIEDRLYIAYLFKDTWRIAEVVEEP